jgi:hypothetical protein
MKNSKLDVVINSEILESFKEHLEEVGYDKNKLFLKILEDFMKKVEKS